jgi:hypothetical protein
MRPLILLPLVALAACGGEAEKNKSEARAASVDAGQWQTDFEVTTFTRRDEGAPKIDSPVGTRSTAATCVAAGNATRPPTTLFVGAPFECEYQDFYMRSGRINLSMQCRHPQLGERVGVTAVGDFTATGYQATVQYTTREAGPGDVVVVTRATGRRTGGACTAPAEPAGNQAAPR